MTGIQIADEICLPFRIIAPILLDLKKQLFLAYPKFAKILVTAIDIDFNQRCGCCNHL